MMTLVIVEQNLTEGSATLEIVYATPGTMVGVPSPTADTGTYVRGAKASIKHFSALPTLTGWIPRESRRSSGLV
jgi:hypothetical protein